MDILSPQSKYHWFTKWFLLLILASAIAGSLSYVTVYSIFEPNKKIEKNKICFYGSNTNTYKDVSTSIQAGLGINVQTNTGGSIDILEKVNQNPYSLGICQLDVFNAFPAKSVRIIDTLYEEKLQILYPLKYGKGLSIKGKADPLIDSIFKKSTLYIGNLKSGTNYTVRKFLNAFEDAHHIKLSTKKRENRRHYSTFSDSTIAFFVSGNIDERIKTILYLTA